MDDIKKALVTTVDIVFKEVTTDTVKKRKTKPDVVGKAITSPILSKNKTDTVKKQRNHKHPIKKWIPPKAIKPTQ